MELFNEIIIELESIDEDENDHEQEQRLQNENVIVNLVDCMECHVPVPRCEVGIVKRIGQTTNEYFLDSSTK